MLIYNRYLRAKLEGPSSTKKKKAGWLVRPQKKKKGLRPIYPVILDRVDLRSEY